MPSLPRSAPHGDNPAPRPPSESAGDAAGLPLSRSPLVGRQQEHSAVAAMLRRNDVALVTLTGPGGVGKTRLALQVAADLAQDFADGVVVVPLASIRDDRLMPPTIAQALGVPDAPGQPLPVRLQSFLQDRCLLLMLDNVEHLLGATPFIVELLSRAPRMKVLATSRTRLAVSGEYTFPVPPLDVEAARQLFAERARALNPTFAIAAYSVPVVDKICARLDRLPLAVELAAARTNVLPLGALLARLEHRLDLLTGGPRDAPPRLRDLREAIAWSYELLPCPEQALFRRIGVFIGGFTLGAAQAVAEHGDDILEGVSVLVTASLVNAVEGVGDEPRFAMLETIREYALELLFTNGEEASVRQRHAEFYRFLTESALPYYDGPELPVYRDRVNAELDNCRAAMTWALDNDAAETGVRLAGALWRIWWATHAVGGKPWTERVTEGLAWCERTLSMRDDLPLASVTEALTGTCFLAILQADYKRARAAGADLLARAQAENYAYGIYWAHNLLGRVAEVEGPDHILRRDMIGPETDSQVGDDAAGLHYKAALAVAPAVRNPHNHESDTLAHLGVIAQRQGDIERASALLEHALRLGRMAGNPFLLAHLFVNLGQVKRRQGAIKEATALLREGLIVLERETALGGAHVALIELSLVAMMTGQVERGVQWLAAADSFPRHLGYRQAFERASANALSQLGDQRFEAAWEAGAHLAWNDILTEIDAFAVTIDAPLKVLSPVATNQHGLSPREVDVLRLLAEGLSNRVIAGTLSLSERTIENHVRHILAKLNLQSRTAAAAFAVRHGIV